MGIARLAIGNPRAFAMGLAVGALLIGSGFLMAVVTMGQVGATHDDSGTYHACVSKYTGATRIMPPGRPPNCSASEFLVELGAGDPAANLTYVVRSDFFALNTVSGSRNASVYCDTGETALSGGFRYRLGDSTPFDGAFTPFGGGPIGSPPTGWNAGYSYVSGPLDGQAELWVLCVS